MRFLVKQFEKDLWQRHLYYKYALYVQDNQVELFYSTHFG